MNFLPEDIQSGVKRDRVKIGSSLADVDPMNVDKSVSDFRLLFKCPAPRWRQCLRTSNGNITFLVCKGHGFNSRSRQNLLSPSVAI